MPEPSLIDERLAEIDRRLRTIQSGLAPVDPAGSESPEPIGSEVPEPPGPDPAREELPPVAPVARVAPALSEPPLPPPTPLRPAPLGTDVASSGEAGLGLVAQLRELSEAHERLLELHRELLSQYAEVLEHRAADTTTVPVSGGPFADAAAVRAFGQAIAQLPRVSDVAVREYGDGDRVMLDVRLAAR